MESTARCISKLLLDSYTFRDGCLQGLRDVGDSIVLMGKNTMMKRSIRLYCEKTGDDKWPALLDHLVGNVGLIFTKADLAEVCSLPLCPGPLLYRG